tara:strand:- start:272 stop:418 length:147 start_codon:yes stop_codon:yes gene_type:complete
LKSLKKEIKEHKIRSLQNNTRKEMISLRLLKQIFSKEEKIEKEVINTC